MIISSKSDVGIARNNNEDYYLTGEFSDGTVWVVICDGMGGTAGGNVASETAAEIIADKFERSYSEGINDNSLRNLILSAIDFANNTVYSRALIDLSLSGMGTTAIVAIIRDNIIHFANVGDSRLYIINKDSINQMTTDHSIVQMMVENGEITQEEAKDHPQKNVITRALGVSNRVKADYFREELHAGDIVLMCSDGLTNYVDTSKIFEICNTDNEYTYADILVDEANKNGGGDNITVVTVTYC